MRPLFRLWEDSQGRPNSMTHALQAELEFFSAMRQTWIDAHWGQFVVIQDKDVLGFFDTYEAAIKAAYEVLGIARPFLVKEVMPTDRVYLA
jgi:hypothetical protein